MIQLIQFKSEMYPIIEKWWVGHGQFPVNQELLPQTSAVAQDGEDNLLAAAWVYFDNSVGVAMLAWPVVDPDAKGKQKLKALNIIIDHLTEFVKSLGYGMLIAFSSKESINRLYKKKEFVAFDKNSTFSAKGLNHGH